MILKLPPVKPAEPDRVPPPTLVTTNLSVLVWPTLTVPNDRLDGLTDNIGTARPVPETLAEAPPPPVKLRLPL